MKKYLLLIVALTLLSLSSFVNAEEANHSLSLKPYFNAKCENLTGTWQGFYTDTQDLFGGGPWNTSLSLLYQNGKVVGQANIPPKRVSMLTANCQNGFLNNLYILNKAECGSYSQGGALIGPNSLVMYVHYENAMNGTDFLVFLKKVNANYPNSLQKVSLKLNSMKIKSCH